MSNLLTYLDDGANKQSQAALCMLQYLIGDGIEESWDKESGRYRAEPNVSRWHNCREQGYVVSLRSKDFSRQINVAFFEHRNSDELHCIHWEQVTTNPPTIDDVLKVEGVYESKHSTNFCVKHGEVTLMAEYIVPLLISFWMATDK